MISNRIPKRTFLLAIGVTVTGLASFMVIGIILPGDGNVQGDEPPIFILSAEAEHLPDIPDLANAKRVDSLRALSATLGGERGVILIDASAADSLPPASLRPFVATGSALFGLNISLKRLYEISSFREELAMIQPKFGEGQIADGANFNGDFFSVVWRTPPGSNPSYWGTTQRELREPIFSTLLRDYRLRVQGLIVDGEDIVPLEEYGQ